MPTTLFNKEVQTQIPTGKYDLAKIIFTRPITYIAVHTHV